MNLVKQMLQKIGLIGSVLVLWVLDDLIVILPDKAVWTLTGLMLKVAGHGDRLDGLKEFWTGENRKTRK